MSLSLREAISAQRTRLPEHIIELNTVSTFTVTEIIRIQSFPQVPVVLPSLESFIQIVQQLISIALTPQSLNCRRSKPPFSCGLVPRISRPCVGPPSFCVPGFPLRRCELFQLKFLLLPLPLFSSFQSLTRTPKQNADKDYTDSSYHYSFTIH